MARRAFLIIGMLFSTVLCFADGGGDAIDLFESKSTLRVSIKYPFLDFTLSGKVGEYWKPIEYTPNNPVVLSFSASYKSFGVSASFDLDENDDEDLYGKTSYTDFQLYYYHRRIGCELFYQKYQGYYLFEPERFGYTEGDPNTIRPDVVAQNIGLNIYYVFSKDFSFSAFMNQTERQRKWDWSFLLMGSYDYFRLESEFSLVPASQVPYYGIDADYRGGSYHSITVSPGIAITVPFYNFFVSGVMFAGYGPSYEQYHNLEGSQKGVRSLVKMNAKCSIGYNGDNLFAGGLFALDSIITKTKASESRSLRISRDSGFLEFYIGIRL